MASQSHIQFSFIENWLIFFCRTAFKMNDSWSLYNHILHTISYPSFLHFCIFIIHKEIWVKTTILINNLPTNKHISTRNIVYLLFYTKYFCSDCFLWFTQHSSISCFKKSLHKRLYRREIPIRMNIFTIQILQQAAYRSNSFTRIQFTIIIKKFYCIIYENSI